MSLTPFLGMSAQGKKPQVTASFLPPMLCQSTEQLPDTDEWLYQLKLDGYRAIAFFDARGVQLRSRNNKDFTRKFPAIQTALQALPLDTVIDGEIVALDEAGRPSFNLLQNHRINNNAVFYVFDVLIHHGRDVRSLPIERRLALLEEKILPRLADPLRACPVFNVPLHQLIASVRAQKLEGIIAKRKGSLYGSDQRTGVWQKMRVYQRERFYVGGYIPSAKNFDALLLGYYNGKNLLYASRTRNGFTPRMRAELFPLLQPLINERCPFTNLPESTRGRWGDGMTAKDMEKCVWLKPQQQAEIELQEWTPAGHLRHSRFVGLLAQKKPRSRAERRHIDRRLA